VLFEATALDNVQEIQKYLTSDVRVIAFDEVQFFGKDLITVVYGLIGEGYRIIAAGLDTDFKGEPFGIIGDLLAQADRVTKLDAVCMQCGGRATRTQRFIDGVPAPYNAPQVVVGGDEMYEARCRNCHIIE